MSPKVVKNIRFGMSELECEDCPRADGGGPCDEWAAGGCRQALYLEFQCPHCSRGHKVGMELEGRWVQSLLRDIGWVGRNKLKFEVRDADLWFLYISTRCRSNHCTKPFLQPLLRRRV